MLIEYYIYISYAQLSNATYSHLKTISYMYSPGEEATEGGKELRQQAGEIMACEYI